jgi:hypothetical protein
VEKADGFNARVLFETLSTVTVLSLLLSIIGNRMGTKQINMVPIDNFLHIWPRNFGIALWFELLVAQPIARFVMKQMHISKERKGENLNI